MEKTGDIKKIDNLYGQMKSKIVELNSKIIGLPASTASSSKNPIQPINIDDFDDDKIKAKIAEISSKVIEKINANFVQFKARKSTTNFPREMISSVTKVQRKLINEWEKLHAEERSIMSDLKKAKNLLILKK